MWEKYIFWWANYFLFLAFTSFYVRQRKIDRSIFDNFLFHKNLGLMALFIDFFIDIYIYVYTQSLMYALGS